VSNTTFTGFPPATLKFLRQLAKNNNRDWFAEHKSRYESDVLAPALDFITAMQKPMRRVSECFDVIPKRTGGSLMRVYRDTRFAKDKTPYKTNVGIQFRHQSGRDVHAPGFYFHISPAEMFLGVGIWHPDSSALSAIRERVADDPAAWKKVRDGKTFKSQYKLAGDSLKRPPRGVDPDHPMIEDLKRKDFIAVQELTARDVESDTFVSQVTKAFRSSTAFMRFLCDALDLPM